jgi:UDP-N-acetylmuramate--alanine ligase
VAAGDRSTGDGSPGLDLDTPATVHVVAVGGSAMSGIALVLAGLGHRVSGSDLVDSARLATVRDAGITVHVGHDAANVPDDVDVVVMSTAVDETNPEVVRARALGAPVLRRSDAQRAIAHARRTIAVAGSHGKTTTSSMLTLVLEDAGWDPSFVLGGDMASLGVTAALRGGDWLVAEADESDGTFLELGAEVAVVTSIEPDHLGHYGGFPALEAAFGRFVRAAPGPRVLCLDDVVTARLAAAVGADAVTYGFAAGADYRIVGYEGSGTGSGWTLEHHGRPVAELAVPIPGRHNARNATAAAATALELGAAPDAVVSGLARFGGLARRFERRGERRGVTFVDDYAHLPAEVAAMVGAAREGGWSRVVVVFQPHRYSRTADLWRDFADAFVGADLVVLTDVYAFNEAPIEGVSGRLVLRAVLDAHPELPVVYLPGRADLEAHVPRLARPGDLVLTLGAGDLTTLPDVWLRGAA